MMVTHLIRTSIFSLTTERSTRQRALWASLDYQGRVRPLFCLRLVAPHERYPRKLAFSWGGGAGVTSPFGVPMLRRRWYSDNKLEIERCGFTAHLRLGRYRCPDTFNRRTDMPWLGVTMNANRWL